MQNYYPDFQEAGAEIVSVVVAPVEAIETWCQRASVDFPMLADIWHEASEAYGVYNLFGDELAAPAVFVIDSDASIVWSYVGRHADDRVSTQTILDHLP